MNCFTIILIHLLTFPELNQKKNQIKNTNFNESLLWIINELETVWEKISKRYKSDFTSNVYLCGKWGELARKNLGPNNLYTKIPWDILRRKTPKFRGMCRYYFLAPPNIFHNFVSFHPILMFLTILESGDKTNNIGDKFKTIRLILINTYRCLGSYNSFSDMKTYFGLWKKI